MSAPAPQRHIRLPGSRSYDYGGRPFEGHKGLLKQDSRALRQHFMLIARRKFRGIDVTLWQRR